MKNEIFNTKRKLYHLLLELKDEDITESYADMLVLLNNDEEIQDLFEFKLKKQFSTKYKIK